MPIADTVANLQPGAANGRQLKITGDGTDAGMASPLLAEGQVIAGGATVVFLLPSRGALNCSAFLSLTFSGTAPTVSLVQTMLDHVTPIPGATVKTLTPTTGTLAQCGPATGLQGEEGCVLTIAAAVGVPVTIGIAEMTAL